MINDDTPGATGRENWTWDEWQEKDDIGLEAMAKTDYAGFNALYRSRFGVDAPQ
ncbi:hypothetical protein D3C78_1841420 [compost metagenome]